MSKKTITVKADDLINISDISITLQTNILPCFGKSTEQKFEVVHPGVIITSTGSANDYLRLVRPNHDDESVTRHKLPMSQYQKILDLALKCLDVREDEVSETIETLGTSTSLSIKAGSEASYWQSRLFQKLGHMRLDQLIKAILAVEKSKI
ncbi:MAG: hypothetical protein H7Z71_05625 [Moraxellaceae bacterium]|nr:hypothetical protein [Pseudobdellovibrionaceae bacterium]